MDFFLCGALLSGSTSAQLAAIQTTGKFFLQKYRTVIAWLIIILSIMLVEHRTRVFTPFKDKANPFIEPESILIKNNMSWMILTVWACGVWYDIYLNHFFLIEAYPSEFQEHWTHAYKMREAENLGYICPILPRWAWMLQELSLHKIRVDNSTIFFCMSPPSINNLILLF